MLVNQYQYLSNILREQRALVAQVAGSVEKAEGTSSGIDYNKPPKNFADAIQNGWKHIGRNIRDSRTETP